MVESRNQIRKLRAKVLYAEQKRINGADTLGSSEARQELKERYKECTNLVSGTVNKEDLDKKFE